MSAHSVDSIAQQFAASLPYTTPVRATREQNPRHTAESGNGRWTVVAARRIGSNSARAQAWVRPQALEALRAMDQELSDADALYLLMEHALEVLGAGITNPVQYLAEGLGARAATFLLTAAGEEIGQFALEIEEGKPVFDEILAAQGTQDAADAAVHETEVAAAFTSSNAAGSGPAVVSQGAGKPSNGGLDTMRMLYDVEMTLTAEIGRAKMPVKQILELVPGTIVELDRVAGSLADLMVNGQLVARGEVVVVDEEYGLRIAEIIDPEGLI
ncbi:flagellar motor switch protein FliN [Timonella senegalensis]|uniref:flagellar motor switch protein FliN n=1 Tax=Timonella senegalensis TaxID=1465825 RepID=UPI002FDE6ACA